jgi:poly(A) polymerase
MDTRFESIRSDERMGLLAGLAAQHDARVWLVGGGLRDACMGRVVRDFDFALDAAVEELPRDFASRIGGKFFWLDRERRQSRVVTGRGEAAFTWDFAPVRGADILEDLALRDFTVNSLALPLGTGAPSLLDPLSGLSDIVSGVIRACGERTFDDDPLRLLRALRFASTLDFLIEEKTWKEIARSSHLLDRVAGERVRDELFLILEEPDIGASLERLRRSGLLSLVIPFDVNGTATAAAVRERISRAARVEAVAEDPERYFPAFGRRFADHLLLGVEGEVSVLSLVKLAAFLSGKDARHLITAACDRLRLGTRARTELLALCGSTNPFPSLPDVAREARALYRFFRDRAPAGPELLLLSLADKLVAPERAARLVSFYFTGYRSTDADLLLSGDQVMALLGIDPGPELGRRMESLREAESLGIATSEAEAREFLLKKQLTKEEPMG